MRKLLFLVPAIMVLAAVTAPVARGETSATSAAAAKPAEVRLQILKPDGTALANGKIVLCNNKSEETYALITDGQGWSAVTTTDSFGTWRVTVWASGAGYGASEAFEVKKGEVTPPQTMRLKVGGTLTGRVVDKESGAPVAKMVVKVVSQADSQWSLASPGPHLAPEIVVETGSDGVWSASGIHPGIDWYVQADTETGGAYLAGAVLHDLELAEGQTVKCNDIVLERAAEIRGVVLASDSKTPVAGATVMVANVNFTTSSDAKGAFVLRGFAVGDTVLAITAGGFVKQKLALEIPANKKVAEQQIVLSRHGGTISGTVADESGKPVAGALVVAVETQGYEQFFGRSRQVLTTEVWNTYKGFGALRGTAESRTDAAGRFEFTLLAEDSYLVVVMDESKPQLVSDMITVEAGKAAPAVKLTRPSKWAGYLTVRLLKPDGSPLVADEIMGSQSSRFGQGSSSGGLVARTGSDGRFYQPFQRSGTVKISLAVPGYRLVELELEADPEKALEREVTLTAEKADGEITGRILMPDGKPAAGVKVIPFVEDRPWPGTMPMYFGGMVYYLGERQAVESGSDGTFQLGGLRPEEYGLIAQTERGEFWLAKGEPLRPELAGCCPMLLVEKVKVAESGRASVGEKRLIKGAKITVTVTEAGSGRPLANAQLMVHLMDQKNLLQRRMLIIGRTDAQGRTQLDGLFPGKYNVTVMAAKHQSLHLMKENAPVLESGQEVEMKIPLPVAAGAEAEKSVL